MFSLLNEISNDDVVLLVDSAFFKGKVLRDFLIARNILTKLHMVNAMRTIFSPVLFWIANYTMNVAMYPAQNKSANINNLSFISLVRWVIGSRMAISFNVHWWYIVANDIPDNIITSFEITKRSMQFPFPMIVVSKNTIKIKLTILGLQRRWSKERIAMRRLEIIFLKCEDFE